MKTLPLKNSQPHPYTQKFVLEARDRETGELLFGSRPSHKPKLPKGEPPLRDHWTPGGIVELFYRMNPSEKTRDPNTDGLEASWETICQFFDSINWFWRPKTW